MGMDCLDTKRTLGYKPKTEVKTEVKIRISADLADIIEKETGKKPDEFMEDYFTRVIEEVISEIKDIKKTQIDLAKYYCSECDGYNLPYGKHTAHALKTYGLEACTCKKD